MKYYEHHLGDYLRDTMHLSILEDGAYRRLIDAYYSREAPIPKSLPVVFRLVRAESKAEKAAVLAVLKEFFVETGDSYYHERCNQELVRYHDKREKARLSGIASGQARRSGRSTNDERTFNEPTNETRTLQSPYSNLQDKEKESEDKNVLFGAGVRHTASQLQRIRATKT